MIKFVLVYVFAVNRDNRLAMVIHMARLVHSRVLDWQSGSYSVIVFDGFAVQATIVSFGVCTALAHHGEDIAMSRGIEVKRCRLVRLKWDHFLLGDLLCHD